MRNIQLIIQYIGTKYLGWQIQPQGPTIQQILQNTLHDILQEEIIVLSASRTDSGVHALGQVASFKTKHSMDTTILHRALNANLPEDIAILSVNEVPLSFRVQKDARTKTYTYLLLNHDRRIPFLYAYTWRLYGKLDLDAMHCCLEMLVGEHDFNAFKAADSTAKTSVRTLEIVSIQRISLENFASGLVGMLGLAALVPPLGAAHSFHSNGRPSLIAINFKGQGFLKHMVRNIVGTVVEVGLGKMTVEDFRRIFGSCDRTQAGRTAPPQGLFLVKVDYEN